MYVGTYCSRMKEFSSIIISIVILVLNEFMVDYL
jgi:hypothetical protein